MRPDRRPQPLVAGQPSLAGAGSPAGAFGDGSANAAGALGDGSANAAGAFGDGSASAAGAFGDGSASAAGAFGDGSASAAVPSGPRVLALHLPDLPLQRLARAREREDGGRPVAVVSEGRVVTCDAAARAVGVRPGDALAQALAACGRLLPVPHAPAADLAALRGLAEALLGLAPAVEVAPPDVLLLDASAAHLLGGGHESERRLLARAAAVAEGLGYATRAALATGRGPARALARHGASEAVVAPGQEARALAALPLEALGLGGAVEARLRAVGVDGVGALARLPPEGLALRFGAAGAAAARLARGDDPTPLVPYLPETLPEEAIELEGPAETVEPVLFVLGRLAERVAARLGGRGLGASRVRLTLKLDPRGEERLLVPLARPSATAARWLLPLRERLLAVRLPGAVTGVRLTAVEVAACPSSQLAFGDRPEVAAALELVLARLSGRLGDGALLAAAPADRHRPEAAWKTVPFRPPAGGGGAGRHWAEPHQQGAEPHQHGAEPHQHGAEPHQHGAEPHQHGAEPEQHGAEPEQHGAAPHQHGAAPHQHGAEPPGGGAGGAGEAVVVQAGPDGLVRPTRLLATPLPAIATGEGGRVTALRLGGQAHAVLSFEGPERLGGEWWGAPFDRDYYRARVAGLGECWLYRDGVDGRLWLHGFFD